jgi:AcrR family transcriptional regulator
MTAMAEPARSERAEQLLRTASDTFYAEGINATGVDTLVERAGVSKPTLYAHFGSKRTLVAAALERRHQQRRVQLEQRLGRVRGSARDRLLAVFDWVGEVHAGEGWRGCPFLNAAAELGPGEPAREVVSRHKRWMRGLLADLAREDGQPEPEELAEQLQLLLEGAHARMLVDGDRDGARRARRVAERLLGPGG